MGMLLVPVVLLLVAVLMMVSVLGASCQALTSGGEVVYDEDTMQDYVDAQYARVYGASEAYEDHILLVFLVDEDHSQFDYYSWLGYDLDQQVRNAFSAPFRSTVQSTVHDPYTYSLTADLTDVVDAMAARVTALGLSSPFKCGEAHADVAPAFCNDSQMTLDETRVLAALQQFTAQTGISISLVVEDRADVFGTYYPVIPLIFSLLLFGSAIYLIVRAVRQRNRGDRDQDDGWNTYGTSSQSDGW